MIHHALGVDLAGDLIQVVSDPAQLPIFFPGNFSIMSGPDPGSSDRLADQITDTDSQVSRFFFESCSLICADSDL